ncbi:Leucine rich repeat/Leucine Rich Repeat [Lotmaria passim]
MKFLKAVGEHIAGFEFLWRCPNFCTWLGVTCAADGVALDLEGLTWSGSLPAVPVGCDASAVLLSSIDFGGSGRIGSVTGTLPENWGSLSRLRRLDLSHTGVSGTLPTSWSTMNLEVLNLGYNNLSGALPVEWAQMNSLVELWLNDNQLTGSVPLEYLFMENLSVLDVSNNQLNGTLPNMRTGSENVRVFGSNLQRKVASPVHG